MDSGLSGRFHQANRVSLKKYSDSRRIREKGANMEALGYFFYRAMESHRYTSTNRSLQLLRVSKHLARVNFVAAKKWPCFDSENDLTSTCPGFRAFRTVIWL
jgi:hypothetical protein